MEFSVESLGTQALTKAHLSEMLFEQIGLNKREAKELVETMFDKIIEELVQRGEVKISGFGSFYVRSKNARPGRNPRTGEPVPVSARRVASFYASQKLKQAVQDGTLIVEHNQMDD